MKRVLGFLLRNWPLKLAAILLATMLYSGLVLSQNVRTFSGQVPVFPIGTPREATILNEFEPVREIRFRAPLDVGVLSPSSFRATVDLSRVQAREQGEAQSLPVELTAIGRGIQIVDFSPRTVEVRLDTVEERAVPVTVEHNAPPEGLSIGVPQADPSEVRIRGAGSRVASVSAVVARVTIDSSALNVNRDVTVVPVDAAGNEVPDVEVEPSRVNVQIAVAVELANRTLAVVPLFDGQLPAGYSLGTVSVEPLTVTVEGSEDVVTRLESAETQPIDVSGRTLDFEVITELQLPQQVRVIGSGDVRVTVAVDPMRGSRTYLAGLTLAGASPELTYRPAVTQVAILLEGGLVDLDRLSAAQLVAQLNVGELEPGEHTLPVTLTPPAGLQVLSIAPSEVLVTVDPTPEPEGASARPIGLLSESRL